MEIFGQGIATALMVRDSYAFYIGQLGGEILTGKD